MFTEKEILNHRGMYSEMLCAMTSTYDTTTLLWKQAASQMSVHACRSHDLKRQSTYDCYL